MRIRKATTAAAAKTTSSTCLFVSFRDVVWFSLGVVATLLVTAALDSRALLASQEASSSLLLLASTSTASSASTSTIFNARTSAQDETGFHPLHIYYGRNDIVTRDIPEEGFWRPATGTWTDPGKRKWFSQHGQDVAVMKVLNYKRDGFFVDLAANDAVWASNTYTLEQHFAWRGVCIEANPIYWHRLAYRHCHAVGAVVGNSTQNSEVEITLASDKVQAPYGGIVGSDFDNKKSKKESVARYTVPLVTILQRFQAPTIIDYLSLDVEGAEWFILSQFPFDRYQFKCLTIERPSTELQALLKQNGYSKALDIARGDTLWVPENMAAAARAAVAINPQEIAAHNSPNLPAHALPR